jgi:hypothetical protein
MRLRWCLVLAVLLAGLASAGCRKEEGNLLVGRWRNWDSLFHIDFAADGECIYDIADRPEYLPHLVHGTYEIAGEGRMRITIDHELSGEFQYKVQEDVLQLTDHNGRRFTYMREKPAAK